MPHAPFFQTNIFNQRKFTEKSRSMEMSSSKLRPGYKVKFTAEMRKKWLTNVSKRKQSTEGKGSWNSRNDGWFEVLKDKV